MGFLLVGNRFFNRSVRYTCCHRDGSYCVLLCMVCCKCMFQNVNELENFPMGRNIYNYMKGIIIVERGSERGYG